MASGHELVLVPRFSANDDSAILVAWTKNNGEPVSEGERICDLEFSKSVVEVPAPRGGFLFHTRAVGDEIAVGKPLAIISDTAERPKTVAEGAARPTGVKVTAKARKLIEAHGLDLGFFQGLGIVKEEHVLAVLKKTQTPAADETIAGEFRPLTPIQRRVARALAESASTIPHSYLTQWVSASAVELRVSKIARTHDLMLSVSDWLVASIARSATQYPKVLTSWRGEGVFYHPRAHVGFALNQSNGELLVPVVHDADQLDLETVVGRIRGLQKKAVRHKLESADLTGGTITVTSLIGTGAHQVFPILVPDQAVIIAIADRCELGPIPAYALTIGFDHRILNGAEAAQFLAALGAALV